MRNALWGVVAALCLPHWAWGQQNWTQRVVVPPDRGFYAGAFDAMHGQFVLFGGVTPAGGVPLADTWVWDGASWTLKTPANSPPARWGAGMVYDSVHAQIVMFGGYAGTAGSTGTINAALSDTWVWDGGNWTQQFPAINPPARYLHSLGYDPQHGQAVLFGGTNSTNSAVFHGNTVAMNDTWLWDGTTWSQAAPAQSPSARSQSSVAYDSVHQQLVLFGGASGGSSTSTLADTWVWDGANWTQLAPAARPAARSGQTMSFDPIAQKAVMFSGDPYSAVNRVLLGGAPSVAEYADTWTWNGSNWSQQAPALSPKARSGSQAAYDAVHQQTVLFGGIGNALNPFNSDTWIWDGNNWTSPPQTVHPSARYNAAVVYDAGHQQVVVFGATVASQSGDTWIWDGTAWTERFPATSPKGGSCKGVYDAARQQVLIVQQDAVFWVWDGFNWTAENPVNSPDLYDYSLSYDALHQQVVMFGLSEDTGNAETWLWDGANWTKQAPVTSPSNRTGPAMVYDAARQQTVLFGGFDSDEQIPLADTWIWDGSNWTQRSPANSPTPRTLHSLAYDSGASEVLLFGGNTGVAGGPAFADTWAWDGANWTLQNPSGSPLARGGQGMVYDAARQNNVLFGGIDSTYDDLSDTWIFTNGPTVNINVPAGIQFTFNGQAYTGSQSFNIAPGSYPLATTSPQFPAGGTQAQFASWSDGGAQSHNVIFGAASLDITGRFEMQYLLTTAASPANGGTVTQTAAGGGGPYYDAGTLVSVTYAAHAGYSFSGWSGACTGSGACFVTMNAPATVTANFAQQTYAVTIDVPVGIQYTLSGFPLTGTQTQSLPAGTYALALVSPQSTGAGTQAVFLAWSDGGGQSHNIVVGAAAVTVTGTFKTQYQLSLAVSPAGSGTISQTGPGSNGPFYDAGTQVVVGATANPGYVFQFFGGACSGSSPFCLVAMSGPESVTAYFTVPLDWIEAFPATSPSARDDSTMAWDSARNKMVLFGGLDGVNVLNDTWFWDTANWSLRTPQNSPSPRSFAAMAFDQRSQQIVFFGGIQGLFQDLADTWIWDGANWTQKATANQPSPRYGARMVFDPDNNAVVLFGGFNVDVEASGTWLWDGSNWTEKATQHSPSDRAFHAMAYDPVRHRVVLFGGSPNLTGEIGDTWEWDGNDWTLQTPVHQPSARDAATMAFDAGIQQVVLFGGRDANGNALNDTWVWNGTDWSQAHPLISPPAREFAVMDYDATSQNLLLFGGTPGNTQLQDTWTYLPPTTTVSDIQTVFNEALGFAGAVNDLNQDGVVNVVDVQIMIDAVLGMGPSDAAVRALAQRPRSSILPPPRTTVRVGK